jgi:hypothetical protein
MHLETDIWIDDLATRWVTMIDRLTKAVQPVGSLSSAALVGLLAALLAMTSAAQEIPDLSGVWLATTPRSGGTRMPPMTARATADREAINLTDDPVIRCIPPGFPRDGLIIYPLEIIQTPKMLVFIHEQFNMVRHIYMDGRQMPEHMPPSMMGYSLGRWENGELVIETTNFSPRWLSGGGTQQYGDMSTFERYRLVNDGQGLEADLSITAPETFTGTWTKSYTWELDPGGMIFEYSCDPNDSRF